MVRFRSRGFVYVGALDLQSTPAVENWTQDKLWARMARSSPPAGQQQQQRTTGGVGAASDTAGSSDEQLEVRAVRYVVSDGSFYLEAVPRPAYQQLQQEQQHQPAPKAPGGRHRRSLRRRLDDGGESGGQEDAASAAKVVRKPAAAGKPTGATNGSEAYATAAEAEAAVAAALKPAATTAAAAAVAAGGTSSRRRSNRRLAQAVQQQKQQRRSLLFDGRWAAPNSSSIHPFSALAFIRYDIQPNNSARRCSGTFISPVDVLTAAHCVWDFWSGTGYRDWRIYPGLDTQPFRRPFLTPLYVTFYRTENATVNGGRVYGSQRHVVNYFDMAVIRVDAPHTSWLGVKYDCGRASYPKTLSCGYPMDVASFVPQCSQCFLTTSQCRPMWMMYNYCFSMPGQSGMGVMDLTDMRLLGVLSGGEAGDDFDYSYWTPIDAFHFSNLERWIWQPSRSPPPPPSQLRTLSLSSFSSGTASSLFPRPSPPPAPRPPPPPQQQLAAAFRPLLPPPLAAVRAGDEQLDYAPPPAAYDDADGEDVSPVPPSPQVAPPAYDLDSRPPVYGSSDSGSDSTSDGSRSGATMTTSNTGARVSQSTSAAVTPATLPPSPSCSYGTLRLADGPNSWSGRLEICLGNAWGTICDVNWGWDDARVACRQLGFPDGGEALQAGWFPSAAAAVPMHTGNVSCSGSEERLTACRLPMVLPSDCMAPGKRFDAGLICVPGASTPMASAPPPPPLSGSTDGSAASPSVDYPCGTEGEVRLAPSTIASNSDGSSISGRLEVCWARQWSTVCDDDWNAADAAVVCRQLGFAGGRPLLRSGGGAAPFPPGPLNMAIWPGSADCTGSERAMLDCRRRTPLGRPACTHQEDAGVVCFAAPAPPAPPQPPPPDCSEDGALRLVPLSTQSPAGTGRLEVCYSGRYGQVCDNGFGLPEARVACRQLGYTYGRPMGPPGTAAAGDPGVGAFFWMSDVRCTIQGTELGFWRLTQCRFSGWGRSSGCDPRRQAVGLRCSNDPRVMTDS